jgi:acetyl-CoA carboxylase carboxyl transferase subunit alpha
MENTWYSVISPESCSSILWRSWDKKEVAAEQLHLTADEMYGFGLVDGIIPEPDGGAHWDYDLSAEILKKHLIPVLRELKQMNPEERISRRIEKFSKMGFWEEEEEEVDSQESIVDSAEPAESSRQEAEGNEQVESPKSELESRE